MPWEKFFMLQPNVASLTSQGAVARVMTPKDALHKTQQEAENIQSSTENKISADHSPVTSMILPNNGLKSKPNSGPAEHIRAQKKAHKRPTTNSCWSNFKVLNGPIQAHYCPMKKPTRAPMSVLRPNFKGH